MLFLIFVVGQVSAMSLIEVIFPPNFVWYCFASFSFASVKRRPLFRRRCTQPPIQKYPVRCMSAQMMDFSQRWDLLNMSVTQVVKSGTLQKHLLPVWDGSRLASDMSGGEMEDLKTATKKLFLEKTLISREKWIFGKTWPKAANYKSLLPSSTSGGNLLWRSDVCL